MDCVSSAANIIPLFANDPESSAVGHAINVRVFRPMLSERKNLAGFTPEINGHSPCLLQGPSRERSKLKDSHNDLKGRPMALSDEVVTRAILEHHITWLVHDSLFGCTGTNS